MALGDALVKSSASTARGLNRCQQEFPTTVNSETVLDLATEVEAHLDLKGILSY